MMHGASFYVDESILLGNNICQYIAAVHRRAYLQLRVTESLRCARTYTVAFTVRGKHQARSLKARSPPPPRKPHALECEIVSGSRTRSLVYGW